MAEIQIYKSNPIVEIVAGANTGMSGVTSASNLGAGTGIFSAKVGNDLQFKSLVAGANIGITSDATTVTISNTAPGFVLTDGSGTTAAGTAVNLGGTLSANVLINGAFNFSLGSSTPLNNFSSKQSAFFRIENSTVGGTNTILNLKSQGSSYFTFWDFSPTSVYTGNGPSFQFGGTNVISLLNATTGALDTAGSSLAFENVSTPSSFGQWIFGAGGLSALNPNGAGSSGYIVQITSGVKNTGAGSNNAKALYINPTLNYNVAGTHIFTGIDYNPTLTSTTGLATHYAALFRVGSVGIGTATPTARLHLAAGTATAGTAPLKLTTGTALTVTEDGAFEYHTSHLYFTIGSTRFQLDQQVTPAWLLASGGTLTGVNTITSNTSLQLNFNGTWTAGANNDFHTNFTGSFTGRGGQAGDTLVGYKFTPTLTTGTNGQTLIGTLISPTFSGTGTFYPLYVTTATTATNVFIPAARFTGTNATGGGFYGIEIANQASAPTESLRIGAGNDGTGQGYWIGSNTNTRNIYFGGTIGSSGPASYQIALTPTSLLWNQNGVDATVSAANQKGSFEQHFKSSLWTGAAEIKGWFSWKTVASAITNQAHTLSLFQSTGSTPSFGTPIFTATELGKIGINIALPTKLLHIVALGTNFAEILLQNDVGKQWHFSNTNTTGIFSFTETGVATQMTIMPGGNVLLGSGTNNAKLYVVQAALTSSWIPALRIDPGAHTGMTAGTQFIVNDFTASTQTWAAGSATLTDQRYTYFRGPTVNAGAGNTFTNTYTVFIDAPTNGSGTTTNLFALGLGAALKLGNWTGAGTAPVGTIWSNGTDYRINAGGSVSFLISSRNGINTNSAGTLQDVIIKDNGTGSVGGVQASLGFGMSSGNLKVGIADGAAGARLDLIQPVLTTAWLPLIKATPGAHTGMTASTEFIMNDFVGATWTWAANAGAFNTQRFTYFRAMTMATGVAADAYNVYIEPCVGGTANWALGLNGKMKFVASPTNDNAQVNLLTVDGTSGEVKYRTVASLGSTSLSGLTAAIATNTINNADFRQAWQWNTLTNQPGLDLSSTSTTWAAATPLVNISLTGTQASITSIGLKISNTRTAAGATNTGLQLNASGGGTDNWAIDLIGGHINLASNTSGTNFILDSTVGTKFGTATTQKIGFWNATPIAQPTTGVAAAIRVGGGGTTITDTDTFDGYTIAKIVKALRNAGILA